MGVDRDILAAGLGDIVPDAAPDPLGPDRDAAVRAKAEDMALRKTARDLAALKARERAALKRDGDRRARAAERHAERLDALKDIEARALSAPPAVPDAEDAAPGAAKAVLRLQGVSRPGLERLLAGLGVDLSVRLTRSDTADMLACLLTCSEAQLKALKSRRDVPVAVKTVISRLLDDAERGSMATVESLWSRIFGTKPLDGDGPAPDAGGLPGLVPGGPVSREAYVVIRDRLMR